MFDTDEKIAKVNLSPNVYLYERLICVAINRQINDMYYLPKIHSLTYIYFNLRGFNSTSFNPRQIKQ